MNQNPKNIVVLGAGESGVGAALLAKQEGISVFVSDFGQIKEAYKLKLQTAQIEWEEGQHSQDRILKADLVIKSPGIPDKVAILNAIRQQGIEVIDEIEFASRYTKATIIAITGSNGKTTTTRMVHHILDTAGWDAGLAGNVGYSLAQQVAEGDREYYAVELSSFQLDYCHNLKPEVMILSNITADHLDRYEYKVENYIASKFRITQNKSSEDLFIYNEADWNTQYGFEHFYRSENRVNCLGISMPEQLPQTLTAGSFQMPTSELSLKGRHNFFNALAAAQACLHLGVPHEAIRKALSSFVNEAHRMEHVVSINDVEYINDSKATNVDAVFYALEAMQKPIVWIAGGIDKGNDYRQIMSLVKDKVRAIICLGKDNSPIIEAFQPVKDWIVETQNMAEAIKLASLYAEAGDVVLLSPACSSFDLFENYKRRGEIFKEILLAQHKILSDGQPVQLKLNVNMNPGESKTDNK